VKIIKNPAELQEIAKKYKNAGKKITLVPTMGALHEGHLKLIDRAKTLGDIIVVSIFVNPTQFGPNEDFAKYPREFENDCKKCEERGVNIIFAPSVEEMYPSGFDTKISCGEITTILEGAIRPGHFDGVCTVVLKLFNASLADTAVFGQKDAQQVMVIKQMVRDLNLPITLDIHPIVRENDGLAMSSRNAYLTADERAEVPMIYEGLKKTANDLHPKNNIESFLRTFYSQARFFNVEYIELKENIVLVAVRTTQSKTRLLDNCFVA
jgi:pantoate--beta-alanine ligase